MSDKTAANDAAVPNDKTAANGAAAPNNAAAPNGARPTNNASARARRTAATPAKRQPRMTSARALLKRLYPYAKPDSLLIACALLLLGGIVAFEMGMPILIRNAIDTFTADLPRAQTIPTLNRISIQYFAIIASVLLLTFLQNYLIAVLGQRFIARLRGALFRHISSQRYSFFNTRPIGALISHITNDVEGMQELFSNILTGLLRNIVTIVGVIATMLLINVRLTLFTLLALPLIIPISVLFNHMLRRASLAVRELTARLTAFISEHIAGIQTIQIFSKMTQDTKQFSTHNNRLRQKMFREIYTNAVFRPLLDILSAVLIAYVFVVSGTLYVSDTISIGVVVAFLSLITRFFQQLTSIADNFLTIQSGLSGLERVVKALDYDNTLETRHIKHDSAIHSGVVAFKEVRFSYGGKEVLHNINFRIRPGETVALVGYTGSGKTTIANLLSRLWDIEHGAITIDGHNINTIPPAELYRNVSASGQQISLFDDTVRENIAFGRDLTDEQIRQTAKLVYVDEYIQRLPRQYDTMLTDGGANQLSFGQRQLLTFARIIAQDPRVIILDEATSGIDSETEQLIQSAIQSVLANRSALVIAHRLSTVKSADRILVLSDGRIIEHGTHDQLIARKGYYAQLWKYQFHF